MAAKPPATLSTRYGIDLSEQVEETIRELHLEPLPDDVVLPGEPDETATTGEEAPAEVFQYTRYVLQGIFRQVERTANDLRIIMDDVREFTEHCLPGLYKCG